MPWDIVPPLAWILRIIGRSRTQARDPRRAAAVDGGASPPARPNGGAVLIAFLAHVCLILAIVCGSMCSLCPPRACARSLCRW
jgi:hypothetical protein